MKCNSCGEKCLEHSSKLCIHCWNVSQNIPCSCGCKDAANLQERLF